MRIFQNFSFTEKLLLAGIAGYMAFSVGDRFVNGPAKYYGFPERNINVFSLTKPDIGNCQSHDISRVVSQQQIDPTRELAKYIDCGNKGFLAAGDGYANFYKCFYVSNSEFWPIENCKSSVPISSLDMGIEMANADRDYRELLKLMGEK